MPLGTQEYQMVKRLEHAAEDLGLVLSSGSAFGNNRHLTLSVPGEPTTYEKFPVYSRGVALANGTVEELLQWISGWKAHSDYMMLLKLDKHITKAEEREAGKVIERALKNEPDGRKK